MVLEETPGARLRRLAHEAERLRRDVARWQEAGRPETAAELRAIAELLERLIDRLTHEPRTAKRRGVPTIFDP